MFHVNNFGWVVTIPVAGGHHAHYAKEHHMRTGGIALGMAIILLLQNFWINQNFSL
jgi:hypothetical protein